MNLKWSTMRKRKLLDVNNEPRVDLTLHKVSDSLLTEFTEKIVRQCFKGNLNAAIQGLIQKALADQGFVLVHLMPIRNSVDA